MTQPSTTIPCPVHITANLAKDQAQDLSKTVRKLGRQVESRCQQCEALDDCPVLQELSSTINTALAEVVDEWNLIQVTAS